MRRRLKRFLSVVACGMIVLACAGQEKQTAAESGEDFPFREMAEAELIARADSFASQEYLVVDFYRIYQQVAYPLPLESIENPEFRVEGIAGYPWEIWMTWDLEERVNSLGWAAQWTGKEKYSEPVLRDLQALAQWPDYDARENPHLAGAHAVRILDTAWRNWTWLGDELREDIRRACERAIDMRRGWLEPRLELGSVDAILGSPEAGSYLHNIPTIATIGYCMAARIARHPLLEKLEKHTAALIQAQIGLRSQGYTEAISYDGYILDFVANWLAGAPEDARRAIMELDELGAMLGQSAILAAPGAVMNVAAFNDVEPREMPFHASAHAKLARLAWNSRSFWYLDRCPPGWLRASALGAVHGLARGGETVPPEAGAMEGYTALVLRTGWEAGDAAVAMSACDSDVGHIQRDNGTLVIGTGGEWLIDDPGYQQYMPGLEREFTIGPTAHNYPLINGRPQTTRQVRRLACSPQEGSGLHAAVDLTAGFDGQTELVRVERHVWLTGSGLVVVADRILGSGIETVDYYWHANRKAALWVEDGVWLIHLGGNTLRAQCVNSPLEGRGVSRLPGTRGQVTMHHSLRPGDSSCIWWVFSLGGETAGIELSGDGLSLEAAGRTFSVE